MTDADELIPFAESLGVPTGDRLILGPHQRALIELLAGDVEMMDADTLHVAARRTGRAQAAARLAATLLLQGERVRCATATSEDRRAFMRRVRDELDLIGRTLGIDVERARIAALNL